MLVLAAEMLCGGFSVWLTDPARVQAWREWRLITHALLPGAWLLFSLSFARGNAALFLSQWRSVCLGAFAVPVVLVAAFHDELFAAAEFDIGATWLMRLGWPGVATYAIVLVCSVLILANLERTFRASLGTMRWRIKFMLVGVGLLFVVRIFTASQALIYRVVDPGIEEVNAVATIVAAGVFIRYFFRTSQFENDVYPSQSLLEGSVIVAFAGVYLLIVGILALVIANLGGGGAFALSAFLLLVGLVFLAILLQSDRVRLYVRQTVSRHFERPVYDYRTIWRKFAEGTASCVEQPDLCRALVTLSGEVFQSLSVSLFLAPDQGNTLTLAASTSLSGAKAAQCAPTEAETADVTSHFEKYPGPVEIISVVEPWAAALQRWQPNEFANGGNLFCAPLVRQGKLVGLMMIGDRVKGIAYPTQDLDVLRCIAEDAAASLLNLQLSRRLSQARELEAFQTMAAFFVHDLKNAASTLNLMLKNLPVHFNDPAFREDALRGIGKTVEHINRLVGRLSQLRHTMEIQTSPCDLNELVANVVRGMDAALGAAVVAETAVLPRVALDQEQIRKVIINLLLNAAEAAAHKAKIRIATSQSDGWVVLTVVDNGCGMSQEFIQRSLFRPFQTTKKTGLGIGMFQSKMIVEAHGGRILVASVPGEGTTFEVHLPKK